MVDDDKKWAGSQETERTITMRSKFDEQLKELNREMIAMGQRIVQSIALAIQALADKDSKLAKQIMDGDYEIDRMQKRKWLQTWSESETMQQIFQR